MFSRGILIICFLTIGMQTSQAQVYPLWFLKPDVLECNDTAVGYAKASFHPDSSAARAFTNGCENYVRYKRTKLLGGQAFWATELGTFWMGADFQEEFNAAAAEGAEEMLEPRDTLLTKEFVVVLLTDSDCAVRDLAERRVSVANLPAPSWIETLPDDETHYYGVGVAPQYFYEMSSWSEAEQMARRSLARAVFIEVRALQKIEKQGQEIRHEEIAVTLQNVEVVGRWRDPKSKLFYVLVRMPKRYGIPETLNSMP